MRSGFGDFACGFEAGALRPQAARGSKSRGEVGGRVDEVRGSGEWCQVDGQRPRGGVRYTWYTRAD